jgi:hypothetical protein
MSSCAYIVWLHIFIYIDRLQHLFFSWKLMIICVIYMVKLEFIGFHGTW